MDLTFLHDYPVTNAASHTFNKTYTEAGFRSFVLIPNLGFTLFDHFKGL